MQVFCIEEFNGTVVLNCFLYKVKSYGLLTESPTFTAMLLTAVFDLMRQHYFWSNLLSVSILRINT